MKSHSFTNNSSTINKTLKVFLPRQHPTFLSREFETKAQNTLMIEGEYE